MSKLVRPQPSTGTEHFLYLILHRLHAVMAEYMMNIRKRNFTKCEENAVKMIFGNYIGFIVTMLSGLQTIFSKKITKDVGARYQI
jgi:hypothetical protein